MIAGTHHISTPILMATRCLRVDPGGYGSCKGTHLSVYVYLMQGECDDQLKWPFCGDITIKLVNQEDDKDHVIETVNLSRSITEKSCQRAVTKVRAGCGGMVTFVPLTGLQPKYVKNDCIKLCIKRVELFFDLYLFC